MKLTWGLASFYAYCSAVAASSANTPGHLYVPKSSLAATSAPDNHIIPNTARLILAQRLKLSRFHSIEQVDARALSQVNTFGGQERLFGKQGGSESNHVLIVVDGVDDLNEFSLSSDYQQLLVSPPQPVDSTSQLVTAFGAQAKSLSDSPSDNAAVARIIEPALRLSKKNTVQHSGHTTLVHIQSLLGQTGSSYEEASKIVFKSIRELSDIKHGFSVAIMMMPRTTTGNVKRSADNFGTFEIPSNWPRTPLENPIDEGRNRRPAEASTSPSANKGQSPKEDGPLRGILKTCYDSESSCEKATRKCSGRGKCTSKYGKTVAKENDCWSCKCEAQISNINKGRQVTYWGGPACQKQDVSTPFWLLASMVIILATVVSAAIGMLYTMGSEELPSVIGAGVSGPKAK